jgi:hypothetical protein
MAWLRAIASTNPSRRRLLRVHTHGGFERCRIQEAQGFLGIVSVGAGQANRERDAL